MAEREVRDPRKRSRRRFHDAPIEAESSVPVHSQYRERERSPLRRYHSPTPEQGPASTSGEHDKVWHYADASDVSHQSYGPYSKSDLRGWLEGLRRDGTYEQYCNFAMMLTWQAGDERRQYLMKTLDLPASEQRQVIHWRSREGVGPASTSERLPREVTKVASAKSSADADVENPSTPDKAIRLMRSADSPSTIQELRTKVALLVREALEKSREWRRQQISRAEFKVIARKTIDRVIEGEKSNPDLIYAPSIDALLADKREPISKLSVQMLKHFMQKPPVES